jgi:class 3 adenylate cyclase
VGVRARLLLAFIGISAFAAVGASAALIAFSEVGAVFDRITRERVPASFTALELSRQVERLASFAPLILAGTTMHQQMATDRGIRQELALLDRLFSQLKAGAPNSVLLSDIESSIAEFRRNLADLQRSVAALRCFGGRYECEFSALVVKYQDLLQRNKEASARLTNTVDRLVSNARTEITKAEAAVAATQRKSTAVLLAAVALSLMSSALIVWLYVGRSIIARLTTLSTSMLAIASGSLEALLPPSGGGDEIDHMTRALHTFRDTAVENERLARLKRFLAPQVAELIVSSGHEGVLDSHRRDVAVVFCDLRGFTAFAETTEPEEVMELLRDYHARLGQLVHKFAGTLERFTGDGLIVLFNDPLRCEEPCLAATRLAVEMRAAVQELMRHRPQLGIRLGFGIGIAYGYATLGRVGFEGRFDYTAIGSVVNLAARLCERAQADEILIDGKAHAEIKGAIITEALGDFHPKGFSRPVQVFNIPSEPKRNICR